MVAELLVSKLPLDTLRYIESFLIKYDSKKHTWIHLACHGNLKGLQWLQKQNTVQYSSGYTSKGVSTVISYAANNGHLDILKWIYSNIDIFRVNIKPSNIIRAINWAASKGHLEIVQFLYENFDLVTMVTVENIGTSLAMDWAAENGQLEVVIWLHENFGMLPRERHCTTWAMNYAAANGYFDVVRWLHENRTEKCDRHILPWLVRRNHPDIAIWFER